MWIRNTMSYGLFTAANSIGMANATVIYPDPPAKVCDGIYIGSLATALNENYLRQHNIGAIINLSGSNYVTYCPVYNIIMDDAEITQSSLDSYLGKFAEGVDMITRARVGGHSVLIHCAAGINRSATLIGMYLIHQGFKYADIITAIESANAQRRVPCLTNQSFRKLLASCECYNRNFRGIPRQKHARKVKK